MNVLFYCTPNSVHDQKWFLRISQCEGINVFVIEEGQNEFIKERFYSNPGIKFLPSMPSFSLIHLKKFHQGWQQIKSLIREYSIDLVHFLFATPYAFWANFINVPYIITTRGSDVLVVAPSLLESNGIKGIHNQLLFRLLKRAFRRASAITSTSQSQKDAIQRLFGTDLHPKLIRTGIDIRSIRQTGSRFLPSRLKGEELIFSPRFMQPIYNLELQIQAIDLLPKEILDNYTFVFIKGKDKEVGYQARMIAELSKIRDLRFLIFDQLSQRQMWSLFNYAKLSIMVPHSDGTPNSALEAMAARCPLIIGNLSYDSDLFENTCLKLEGNDPAALADSICRALTEYPEDLLESAYQKVNELADINRSVQELIKLYEDALFNRSPAMVHTLFERTKIRSKFGGSH